MGDAMPQIEFPGDEEGEEFEIPNFAKMKKAELLTFIESHDVPIEDPSSLKLADLRKALAGAFGQFVPESPGLEDGNTLHDVVKQVQNIQTEAEAIAEVLSVQDQSNFSLFRIGGILSRMRAKGWMGEAEDFFDFVENTFAMKKRKAQYALAIYDKLVELDLPWDQASKLGWTKLRLLHTILDEENVNDLIAQVGTLSVREVEQFVRDYKTTDGSNTGGGTDGDNAVKRMNFSVHEDQVENIQLAIDKAKEEGNTTFDGMALEYIALDFLNSGAKPKAKPMTVPEAIKAAKQVIDGKPELEEAMLTGIVKALTEAWPAMFEEAD